MDKPLDIKLIRDMFELFGIMDQNNITKIDLRGVLNMFEMISFKLNPVQQKFY